ncbi:hypothetical protein ACIQNG_24270 [Streptomyces sp. NPDC091377]|uniref:hypothetical protein n=1 Tax=Streptomyces sp. NPDC091377 TaxID=3365995 RepID=UPI003819E54B
MPGRDAGWERETAELAGSIRDDIRVTLGETDETHRDLAELRQQLALEMAETEVMLGGGDGLPLASARAQLSSAGSVLARAEGVSREYLTSRTRVSAHPEYVAGAAPSPDLDVLMGLFDALVEQSEAMAGIMDALAGAIECVLDLQEWLERLQEELAPLRERAHATLRATQAELSATEGSPGWPARRSRLIALTGRLTALDEGRVRAFPDRGPASLYEDVERELSTLRAENARGDWT